MRLIAREIRVFGSKLADEPHGLAALFLAPTGHDHLGPCSAKAIAVARPMSRDMRSTNRTPLSPKNPSLAIENLSADQRGELLTLLVGQADRDQ